MEAQRNPELLEILNRSLITTPDGMPTVWVGRLQGQRKMGRVYGPDFMLNFCSLSITRGYRHFLYGGNPGVADQLTGVLTRRFPGLRIVGTYTPPYGHSTGPKNGNCGSWCAPQNPTSFGWDSVLPSRSNSWPSISNVSIHASWSASALRSTFTPAKSRTLGLGQTLWNAVVTPAMPGTPPPLETLPHQQPEVPLENRAPTSRPQNFQRRRLIALLAAFVLAHS